MKSIMDAMDVLFSAQSRAILHSLTHPPGPRDAECDQHDRFEPTIGSAFNLLHELVVRNTPDLYEFEWDLICRALEASSFALHCLPMSIGRTKSQLVLSLEDLHVHDQVISSFELSKKVAGLADIQIIAIRWVAQLYFVAKGHGEPFRFPGIESKVKQRDVG
jgi:hypothetical protein